MNRTTTRRSGLRGPAFAATAVALAVNLALLALGRAAGASFAVPDRRQAGEVMEVGAWAVALSTLLPLAVGLAAAALFTRRWPRASRALQAAAVVITIGSLGMPLNADTDAGARLLLAAMHLVVGGAYVVALRRGAASSAATVTTDAGAVTAANAR